jgi:hypothetical protein
MSYFLARHLILAPIFAAALAVFPLSSLAPGNEKFARSEAHSRGDVVVCENRAPAPQREPAYHHQPPTGLLPATLDPAQFRNEKVAFVAYCIARKIRGLLYQEPCYCECDQFAGHQSLLDCYTSRHGRGCEKCQAEVFFIYEQSRAGRTADEIRALMDKGDYRKIDTQKYAAEHLAEYRQSAP